MPTATSPKKVVEPTVSSVREAVGRTWFDITDEETRIDLTSRDYGDVGSETPGKEDIKEGMRLFDLLKKVFKPSKWELRYETVDEWVTVSVRTTPWTPRELAKMALEKKLDKLKKVLSGAVTKANEEQKSPGCRDPFSSYVHYGDYSRTASLKVNFGVRYLYKNHVASGFVFATEEQADAALKPIVEQFPNLKWGKTIREPQKRRTGNYSPPHNVIEEEGYIEYSADIRDLQPSAKPVNKKHHV